MVEMTFDNPFDPNTQDYDSRSRSLDEIIRMAVNNALLRVGVSFPAQVTQVISPGKVTIQPLLKVRYTNQSEALPLPPIQNVPVWFPRGNDYYIKPPVKAGDTGLALVCQRSLDAWLVQGGVVDPADLRHHDITDSIFFPGLYPFGDAVSDSTDDLVVKNGSSEFRVQKSGTFQIKNKSQELIDLVSQLAEFCSEIENAGGPTANSADFVTLKSKIDELKG